MVCEDAFGVITIVNNVVSMMNQLKGKIMADFYYIQINNTSSTNFHISSLMIMGYVLG
jgi:hypothetical protein